MEILVIGDEVNLQECRQKFGEGHYYRNIASHSEENFLFNQKKVIFDFIVGNQHQRIEAYQNYSGIAFLDVSRNSLTQMTRGVNATFFGFCGLPAFLNREILEVSLSKKSDEIELQEVCNKLTTKFAVVKDQVGLITPRIICMIINEAYFSIQENIASRSDIDLAMKLGTNYPFGPFEWGKKIGIKNVYELLRSVYESTNDDRYKICKLLEEEAMLSVRN